MGGAQAKEMKELKEAIGDEIRNVKLDNVALGLVGQELKTLCKENPDVNKAEGFTLQIFLKFIVAVVLERHAIRNVNNIFFRNEVIVELFSVFDTNHDGRVSVAEFVLGLGTFGKGSDEERQQWLFESYDMDGDGKISKEDFAGRLESGLQNGLIFLKGQDAKTAESTEGNIRKTNAIQKVVNIAFEADSNGDGFLDADEWRQGCSQNAILQELCKWTDTLSILRHYSK